MEFGYDNQLYTHPTMQTSRPAWELSVGLVNHLQISEAEAKGSEQVIERWLCRDHRLHLGVNCVISSCSSTQQLEFNMLRA